MSTVFDYSNYELNEPLSERKGRNQSLNFRSTFALGNNQREEFKKSSDMVQRGKKCDAPYSHYCYTTQIVHLPGGEKRNSNDINDNQKEAERIQGFMSVCRGAKIYNDFKSKVAGFDNTLSIQPKEYFIKSHCNGLKNKTSDNYFLIVPNMRGKKINQMRRSNLESSNYVKCAQGLKKSYKNVSSAKIIG